MKRNIEKWNIIRTLKKEITNNKRPSKVSHSILKWIYGRLQDTLKEQWTLFCLRQFKNWGRGADFTLRVTFLIGTYYRESVYLSEDKCIDLKLGPAWKKRFEVGRVYT